MTAGFTEMYFTLFTLSCEEEEEEEKRNPGVVLCHFLCCREEIIPHARMGKRRLHGKINSWISSDAGEVSSTRRKETEMMVVNDLTPVRPESRGREDESERKFLN